MTAWNICLLKLGRKAILEFMRVCFFLFLFLLGQVTGASSLKTWSGTREVFVGVNQAPLPLDGGLKIGEIALTFDDGPDPVTTLKILNILKKHHLKAMFFEVGTSAQAHPEVTRAILNQGHSLGSHSWDHQDLTALPLQDALENIQQGQAAVMQAGHLKQLPFFRFPYFASTPELLAAVQRSGLIAFGANIVTEDWMTPDSRELLAKSLRYVEDQKKGILLFHDVQPQTAEMLDEFLTEINKRGYRTVVFRLRD